MNNYPLVSVFTCVYNGARTIDRVFQSVKRLDYPNIEHIIVNDGSTDETDFLIRKYITEAPVPVKYHKKEQNGGKHTAVNIAWDLAEGDFLVLLDADDELPAHSVRFLVDTYFNIPEEIRDQYWCVHGRCVTQHGKLVGKKYPEDINDHSWREAQKIASAYRTEMGSLQVRKYVDPYRFPEVVGVTHVPEGIIWKQINKSYGTWYTNEITRIYYVGEGGNLCANTHSRKQYSTAAFYQKWMFTHKDDYEKSWASMARYALYYFMADKKYRKNNGYLEDCTDKFMLVLLAPIAFFGALVERMIKKIH